ncbi:aldo/keto reductase [bacterium]|nr:aldo/keto reductase [bacterium]
MTYSDKIPLGRTGLLVSRMGIGCSYGVDTSSLIEAFEKGINYFYFGTVRRAAMAKAIHELAPHHRDALVVAIQSYSPWPGILRKSVDIALKKLHLEHADILILGKMDKPPTHELVDEILRIRDSGKVRFLAISAHDRSRLRSYIDIGLFDILMVRYNAAHTGAETEVFSHLPAENRPGVVCYTATRWGTLLKNVSGERTAAASDCYRFCLHEPSVDICLSGPKNRKEMEEALRVLHLPPMSADELAWMRRIGTNVYNHHAHTFLLRKLIFD